VKGVRELLACPICKKKLLGTKCANCSIEFATHVPEIPSFICEQMYESETAYQQALRTIDFWGKGWAKRLKEDEHAFIYSKNKNELHDYAEEQIAWCRENKTLMGKEVPLGEMQGKTVLNIGCGAGTESLCLAHAGAQCIAMDITNEAAEATNNLLEKVGGGFGIQGDARFIPLFDSSVDYVYSSGVLHHSSDIEKSVAEIHRVLKPGGTAYVMLYAKWSITFLQEKLLRRTGEMAWETGSRKNPLTDVFSVRDCKLLFSMFNHTSTEKRGGSLTQLAKTGGLLPKTFDRIVEYSLGPNINIESKK